MSNSFASLLLTYRKMKGMSHRKLGRKCSPSLSDVYLLKIERPNDKKAPPPETVVVIANALELTKEETQNLLDAAERDRFIDALHRNGPKIDNLALCLRDYLKPTEALTLAEKLQELAVAAK